MRNRFIFSALTVLVLSSFTGKNDGMSFYQKRDSPAEVLVSHKWYLTTIHKPNGYTQVLIRNAFIIFNIADGKTGGNGSCNSFGGTLVVTGNDLSISNLFSTKIYCSDVQSIEDDFLKQLRKVTRYEIKGNILLLFEKDNLLLEFKVG